MIAAGLLAACTAIGSNELPSGARVFPTATNSTLFEGNVPAGPSDAPVSLAGAPTVAGVFRIPASATPSPQVSPPTSTLPAQTAETESPTPTAQPYTVLIYGDSLNPNWVAQPDTGVKIDLKSSRKVYRGDAAISLPPRKRGGATSFFAVSDHSQEEYRRNQVAKLSFRLYSPKDPLYLDQFAIAFVGSKRLPYWSAEDQKVADFLSVYPRINLNQLGFDRAIPADTWVLVEINLDQDLALAPEYQYLTGISFTNTTDPARPLLIDDVSLTLRDKPPKRSTIDITPRIDSK